MAQAYLKILYHHHPVGFRRNRTHALKDSHLQVGRPSADIVVAPHFSGADPKVRQGCSK
jgi:hypothetical protein